MKYLKELGIILVSCMVLTACAGADASEYYTPETAADTAVRGSGGSKTVGKLNLSDDAKANDEDVLHIDENVFLITFNDINVNPQDYIGKTIEYEGIVDEMLYEPTGQTFHYVMRYGPGCCGNDGNVGFEVVWDKDIYPAKDTWVRARGVLESYEEDGWNYLRLNLSALDLLPEEEYGNERVDW